MSPEHTPGIRATHTGRKWADIKEVSLTRPIRRKRRKVRVRFAFEDDGFMVVELSDDDALALADALVDYTEMERHA